MVDRETLHQGANRYLYIPTPFKFIEEIQRQSKDRPEDEIYIYHIVEFTLTIIAHEGGSPKDITWKIPVFIKRMDTKKFSDLSYIYGKIKDEIKGSSPIEVLRAIEKVIMKDEELANYYRSLVAKAKGARFDL